VWLGLTACLLYMYASQKYFVEFKNCILLSYETNFYISIVFKWFKRLCQRHNSAFFLYFSVVFLSLINASFTEVIIIIVTVSYEVAIFDVTIKYKLFILKIIISWLSNFRINILFANIGEYSSGCLNIIRLVCKSGKCLTPINNISFVRVTLPVSTIINFRLSPI
jgi:hypothetical protein